MSLTKPKLHLFIQVLVRVSYMYGTTLEEVKNMKMHDIVPTFTEPTILWGELRKIQQKAHHTEMV